MLPASRTTDGATLLKGAICIFVNNILFEKHCLIGYLVTSLMVDANASSMTPPDPDFCPPRERYWVDVGLSRSPASLTNS